MGVQHGMKVFGVHLKHTLDLTSQLQGKRAAFEAYGFLHELLSSHFRSQQRAVALSSHLCVEAPLSSDFLYEYVDNFVKSMQLLNTCFTGGFIVVFEGPSYIAKQAVTEARRLHLHETFQDASKSHKALSVPDCAVKLCLERLDELGISWLIPPAEADAQMAFLQVSFHLLIKYFTDRTGL